jgi:hypothetical protein
MWATARAVAFVAAVVLWSAARLRFCKRWRSGAKGSHSIDSLGSSANSRLLSSPHFLRTLLFRPGIDQVSSSAFTALSSELGRVLVVVTQLKATAAGRAAQGGGVLSLPNREQQKQPQPQQQQQQQQQQHQPPQQHTELLRMCSCVLTTHNVGYAYFEARAIRPAAPLSMQVEVVLLEQLASDAARNKALAKHFAPPQRVMRESPANFSRFVKSQGGAAGMDAQCGWIRAIMDGSREADRTLLVCDDGCVYKWKQGVALDAERHVVVQPITSSAALPLIHFLACVCALLNNDC